jgi:hypothetical protein
MLFAISQHEVSTLRVGFGYWSLEFRWDLKVGTWDFPTNHRCELPHADACVSCSKPRHHYTFVFREEP